MAIDRHVAQQILNFYDFIEEEDPERIHANIYGPKWHQNMKTYDCMEMSRKALEEPGYLLRITATSNYRGPPEELITRTLRVPRILNFHQLHGILERALGWHEGNGYEFELWDGERRHAGHGPYVEGLAKKARETLVEDPGDMEIHEWDDEEMNEMNPNYKSSKTRKLAQVFGGSRVWTEQPYRVQYEVFLAKSWEYRVEFLGETDEVLEEKPGQEVFCVEGEGFPSLRDFRTRFDMEEDLRMGDGGDGFDLDAVNERLEFWCLYSRMHGNPRRLRA